MWFFSKGRKTNGKLSPGYLQIEDERNADKKVIMKERRKPKKKGLQGELKVKTTCSNRKLEGGNKYF